MPCSSRKRPAGQPAAAASSAVQAILCRARKLLSLHVLLTGARAIVITAKKVATMHSAALWQRSVSRRRRAGGCLSVSVVRVQHWWWRVRAVDNSEWGAEEGEKARQWLPVALVIRRKQRRISRAGKSGLFPRGARWLMVRQHIYQLARCNEESRACFLLRDTVLLSKLRCWMDTRGQAVARNVFRRSRELIFSRVIFPVSCCRPESRELCWYFPWEHHDIY